MGEKISSWREWEISTDWTHGTECPDCGHSLIITELITANLYNGICPLCRKQYTTRADDEALTVNPQVADQQDRIAELEARITRLEAIVQKLTERKPLSLPVTPKPEPEEADFRKKYGYLF